jgi:probable phosphomutase (TIGR03848 family)
MALIYLLRHAESSANLAGILAGRSEGITLSKRGRAQSRALATALKAYEFRAIYSSPLERCLETIEPYASLTGKRVKLAEEFIEMDYGHWSGRKLNSLRREKLWKTIQKSPSKVRFPEGESFPELAKRIKSGMKQVSRKHPRGGVLVVSHGDPIKVAISIALGLELDHFQKLVVDPGSLTIIDWPSGTLICANVPLASKRRSDGRAKKGLTNRKVLGGGTNA